MFAGVDPAVVRPHMISQRIQVERLKRLARVQIFFVVTDEERSLNEMNIDFDADEPER